jgi:DNA-binding transcriptional LysR family regulator
MELRHLHYFCAVVLHGTFSEAGRQLHVSQSAISEQIADLERPSGVAISPLGSAESPYGPHGCVESGE